MTTNSSSRCRSPACWPLGHVGRSAAPARTTTASARCECPRRSRGRWRWCRARPERPGMCDHVSERGLASESFPAPSAPGPAHATSERVPARAPVEAHQRSRRRRDVDDRSPPRRSSGARLAPRCRQLSKRARLASGGLRDAQGATIAPRRHGAEDREGSRRPGEQWPTPPAAGRGLQRRAAGQRHAELLQAAVRPCRDAVARRLTSRCGDHEQGDASAQHVEQSEDGRAVADVEFAVGSSPSRLAGHQALRWPPARSPPDRVRQGSRRPGPATLQAASAAAPPAPACCCTARPSYVLRGADGRRWKAWNTKPGAGALGVALRFDRSPSVRQQVAAESGGQQRGCGSGDLPSPTPHHRPYSRAAPRVDVTSAPPAVTRNRPPTPAPTTGTSAGRRPGLSRRRPIPSDSSPAPPGRPRPAPRRTGLRAVTGGRGRLAGRQAPPRGAVRAATALRSAPRTSPSVPPPDGSAPTLSCSSGGAQRDTSM